ERWEIQATLPPNSRSYSDYQKRSNDTPEVNLMLQVLLEDRFRMKVHRETREIPVYAITIGKNGPKLKETQGDQLKVANDSKIEVHGMASSLRVPASDGTLRSRMTFQASTMQSLAGTLGDYFEQPVIDRTGIKGEYDFALEYEVDPNERGPVAAFN